MDAKLMGQIFQAQGNLFKQLPKLETHCMDLSLEVTKRSSKNFILEQAHYTVDGLRKVYRCSIDNRRYEVLIRPMKG